MADKVVRVRIDGVDGLSDPANKAGGSMDKLTQKSGGWMKSFVDVKAALQVVGNALRSMYGFAQESLAAFDAYESSMRKIEGTAKITGTPLAELTELASHAKTQFGLSSVQANDYATAVNNLASKAGFAGDKQKLLASMLDLGAAKGLTAAQSLQAFEQSILGIDEGTDKLFGKNPSGLWADYAEQIGKAPGKMSDLDKSMVLVYATMEAGGMVQGSYSEWLESAQGQQSLLTNRLNDGKVAFGGMLSPIRAVVVEGLNTFMDALGESSTSLDELGNGLKLIAQNVVSIFIVAWQRAGPMVVFALKAVIAGVMFLTDATRALMIFTQEVAGRIVMSYGYIMEKGGKLLSALGIEFVESAGKSLKEWGSNQEKQASASWAKFRQESRAAWDAVGGHATDTAPVVNKASESIGNAGSAAHNKVKVSAEEAAAAQKKEAKEIADAHKKVDAELKIVNASYKFMKQSMESFDKQAEKALKPERAKSFTTGMEGIRKATDEVVSSLMDTLGPVDALIPKTSKVEQIVGKVGEVILHNSRAVLDLAGAFGIVDDEAQVLIGSAINLAQALPKALAGDFSAIGGVLAASANIMSQIVGGDAERRKLLKENSTNLLRLRDEVGNLRLGVTGDSFAKAQTALEQIVPALKRDNLDNKAFNIATIIRGLQAQGLSMADLDEIGKALSVNVRDSKGNLQIGAFKQLLEAIGLTEFGQFGTGFTDRIDSTTRGFDVNKVSAADQIAQLFGVGADFSPALRGVFDGNDLGGTRGRLAGLFAQLQAGTLDASQFGGLTGTQFLDLITDLIGRIDGLDGSTPTVPTTPTATPPAFDDPIVPSAGSPPSGVASDLLGVFRGYAELAAPHMVRMEDLTAAIAENTALTVDELRQVNAWLGLMSGGVGIDLIDAALAERRQAAGINAGGSASP